MKSENSGLGVASSFPQMLVQDLDQFVPGVAVYGAFIGVQELLDQGMNHPIAFPPGSNQIA